ncbi:D-arabinose 5-phosphate isomerase, partial [Vibrio parahaemolyticus]
YDAMYGIYTDGDLRRTLEKRVNINTTGIGDVMTKHLTTSHPDMFAVEGMNVMQNKNINAISRCKEDKNVGALNMHVFLKAGVM